MGSDNRAKSAKDQQSDYSRFALINGEHDYQKAVPDGFVSYSARKLKGAEVTYFNFRLAKEMGLIPENHPNQLNSELIEAITDTFAIQIINEYDLQNKKQFNSEELKPNRYMATRYLQLQHPNKKGYTSGDGRSIWNGQIKHKGKAWDISSCGTGATCLSPATAIHKKFFRTGDPEISYGCGYADPEEGLNAALMSEIFHQNGIPTERTLAILSFNKSRSINVRSAPCLLRPSHFFRFLKQDNHQGLKASIDFFIGRQIQNSHWPKISGENEKYQYLLNYMADSFARATAQFEHEYIFCWMDWDGDNILATQAGIIDYGSVRQFGLYHKEYRYDDVDRFSTNIPEQKRKAKYTVQTFAQLVDFLLTKKKKNISYFQNDKSLRHFELRYKYYKKEYLLKRMGFQPEDLEGILASNSKLTTKFLRSFSYFEEKQSKKGTYKVTDGITSDAVFCMRDLLRELPKHYVAKFSPLAAKTFLQIGASTYAKKSDLILSRQLEDRIEAFQQQYLKIITIAAKNNSKSKEKMLVEIMMRSSILNQYDRITGDGIINVTQLLLKKKKQLTHTEFLNAIQNFIEYQTLEPQRKTQQRARSPHPVALKLMTIVKEHREGI